MADVVLFTSGLTIPDAHVTRVMEIFNAVADGATNNRIESAFGESIRFVIQPRDVSGGEGQKAFGERVIKQVMKKFLDSYDVAEDREDRYLPAINAVDLPNSDLSEDILQ